jgi:hypothetical protein
MTRGLGARQGRMSEVGQIDAEPIYEACGGLVGDGRARLTSSLSAGQGQCARQMQNFTRYADRTGDPTRTALARCHESWRSRPGRPRSRSALVRLRARSISLVSTDRPQAGTSRSRNAEISPRTGRTRHWASLAAAGVGRWS